MEPKILLDDGKILVGNSQSFDKTESGRSLSQQKKKRVISGAKNRNARAKSGIQDYKPIMVTTNKPPRSGKQVMHPNQKQQT